MPEDDARDECLEALPPLQLGSGVLTKPTSLLPNLTNESPMKSHLGIYGDWIEASTQLADLYPVASPGEETRQQIR
jgi:hypothetical protein